MTGQRYYEDLAVGQTFGTPRRRIEQADIVAFASTWDPQPFHTDPEAAKSTLFKGLVASGWHTAVFTMRLLLDGETRIAGGTLAGGIETLSWLKPVRPGDELRAESTVMEMRESKSRPERGIVRMRTTTFNQHDEPVQVLTGILMVPRRAAGPTS